MKDWDQMIDDHILGRLGAEQAAELEAELAQDPELRQEYELRLEVHQALLQSRGQDLRARMRALDLEPRRRRTWMWTSAAAVVLVLAVLGWRWLGQPDRLSTQELLDAHIHAEPQFEIQRGPNSPLQAVPHAVLARLYDEGRYAQVDSLLETVPDSLLNLEELYLQAICLTRLGQFESALTVTDRIITAPYPSLIERGLRLRILLLIRTGQLAEAKTLLPQLESKTSDPYKGDTQAIRDWLEAAE